MENSRMNHWKKEYDEIAVPETAEFRIRLGIKKAKRERRQRTFIKGLRNTGTVAAASLVVLMVAVNTNEALAKSLEDVPVLGRITRIVTWNTYTDHTNNFEAKVAVPKIEVEPSEQSGGLDEEVRKNYELSNEQIEAYAKQFIEMYEADLKATNGEGNYALDSQYKVIGDNDRYLSIRIDTTVVMAGGTQYVKIFNVNKATGKLVTLPELFTDQQKGLEAVSENIKQQMKSQMEQDENIGYFYDTGMPDMDFKGLTGEESFYFNESGELVIAFNEYDVAPGYMGAVEFTIPKAVTDAYR